MYLRGGEVKFDIAMPTAAGSKGTPQNTSLSSNTWCHEEIPMSSGIACMVIPGGYTSDTCIGVA